MGLFRSSPPDPPPRDTVAVVDEELRRAVERLHGGSDPELLRGHIDDLLDRRLQAHDDNIIGDYERLLSHI